MKNMDYYEESHTRSTPQFLNFIAYFGVIYTIALTSIVSALHAFISIPAISKQDYFTHLFVDVFNVKHLYIPIAIVYLYSTYLLLGMVINFVIMHYLKYTQNDEDVFSKKEIFCSKCKSYVEKNSRHCVICEMCIKNRDHHCFFVGICISDSNLSYFFVFCFYAIFGCIHCAVLLITYMHIRFKILDIKGVYNYFFPITFIKTLLGYISVVDAFLSILLFFLIMSTFSILIIAIWRFKIALFVDHSYNNSSYTFIIKNLYNYCKGLFGPYFVSRFIIPIPIFVKIKHSKFRHYDGDNEFLKII